MRWYSLALLSIWLALPGWAGAASPGDDCSWQTATPTAGTTASTRTSGPLNMQIGTPGVSAGGDGNVTAVSRPQVLCEVLCDDGGASGTTALTCGPVYVTGGGQYLDMSVIRVVAGNQNHGCGYDDVQVFEQSSKDTSNEAEKTLLGTLDDDGTLASGATTGVHEIKTFGAIGPWIYLKGAKTDTAETCGAGHRTQIQLLLYPKSAIH
jgi:hypothetical protein